MAFSWPSPPLNIYIIWHPEFPEGEAIAKHLFHTYRRKVVGDNDLGGMGIPVYYRTNDPEAPNFPPPPIDPDKANSTAIILLMDEALCDAYQETDSVWHSYIQSILNNKEYKSSILPIAISEEVLTYFPRVLTGKNAIRWFQWERQSLEKTLKHLTIYLTIAFIRLLRSTMAKPSASGALPKPVRLFLSHSKRDGRDPTLDIREEIQRIPGLSDFFDEVDIPIGYDFKEALSKEIERCALLVVLTDQYAHSEWCRWEVLTAKQLKIPITVAFSLTEGEVRSFPYLGNVPTVPFHPDSPGHAARQVLQLLLKEVLRITFWKAYVEELRTLEGLKIADAKFLPRPPEALTLVHQLQNGVAFPPIIVHPDPPLGTQERSLLEVLLKGKTQLTTPAELLTRMATTERELRS